jgi:hypothetical protein
MSSTHRLGSAYSHFQYEDETVTAQTLTLPVATVVPDELVVPGEVLLLNLIRVDLQGHVAHALRGSMRSIGQTLPIIVFSNHSHWELDGVRSLLSPLGYDVFDLTGSPAAWDDLNIHSAILRIPGRSNQNCS